MVEPGTPEHKILASGGIMILIMLSLFGNLLVCFAVYYSRNLRARVNYLIVSLAISDILIAGVSMPLWMAFEITNYRNLSHEASLTLMKVHMFVDILGGIASIANLVAISFERLWSVFSPLKHRRYMTNFTLFFIVAGVWAYAIFVAATTLAWWHKWEYVILYNAVIGFFFPLFLIFVAYSAIYIIVNRSPRTVVSPQDNFKINMTICIIVGLFVVCWAPHFMFSVLHYHCDVCFDHFLENLWYRSLTMWLHYANSCVNPIVYGIANAQYKEAFKLVFKKICLCCFFKDTSQTTEVDRPTLLPHNYQDRSICSDYKLRVELEPSIKEGEGAVGYDRDLSMYPPGDYRALPNFSSPSSRRWNSTTTAETTFLSSLGEDECASLQTALLTSDSYPRRERLPPFSSSG